MAKNEHSDYQKKVISNYYHNLDAISLQRLSELVTELYLADKKPKQDRLWQKAHQAMINLKIPDQIIDHIISQKSIEILAKNLNDWLKHAKK